MNRRNQIVGLIVAALLMSAGPITPWRAQAADPAAGVPEAGPDDLIAYVCVQKKADATESHICTIRPDGTHPDDPDGPGPKILPNTNGAFGPSWSPDGRHIAFSRGDGWIIGARNNVFVMDADGTNQVKVGPGSVPSWAAANSEVVLDARESDTSENISNFVFDSGETPFADVKTRSPRVTRAYAAPGRYLAGVWAAEDPRSLVKRSVDVPAGAGSPEPDFRISANVADAGTELWVDAGPTSSGSGPLQYRWTFDGPRPLMLDDEVGFGVNAEATHNFPPETGEVVIQLDVRSPDGVASLQRVVDLSKKEDGFLSPRTFRLKFSSDASAIAYVSTGEASDGRVLNSVETMNLYGQNRTQPFQPHPFYEYSQEDPAYLPNARRPDLFYSEQSGGREGLQFDLYRNGERLKSTRSFSEIQPTPSPDGSHIAYVSCLPFGSQGKCAATESNDVSVAVLKDGYRISEEKPLARNFCQAAEGSEQPDPDKQQCALLVDPAWSPDSSRLAYGNRAMNGGIFVVSLVDEKPLKVPHTDRFDRSPAWRPPPVTDEPPAIQLGVQEDDEFIGRSTFDAEDSIRARLNSDVDDADSFCVVPSPRRTDKEPSCGSDEARSVHREDDGELIEVATDDTPLAPGRYVVLAINKDGTLTSRPFAVLCGDRCPKTFVALEHKASARFEKTALEFTCFATQALLIVNEMRNLSEGFKSLAGIVSLLAGANILIGTFAPKILDLKPTTEQLIMVINILVDMILAQIAFALRGLATGASGGQVLGLGGAVALSIGCMVVSGFLQQIINDPPDDDFDDTMVVDPSAVVTPPGSSGEVIRQMTLVALQERAVLAGLEKSQGAEAAGDVDAQLRQLTAMQHATHGIGNAFDTMTQNLASGIELTRTDANANSPLLPESAVADIDRFRDVLVANGFTQEQRTQLASIGIEESEVEELLNAAAVAVPSRMPFELTPSAAADRANSGLRQSAASAYALEALNARARAAIRPAPFTSDQHIEVGRDTSRAVDLDAPDPHGGVVAYTIDSPPTHGTLFGTAPDLVYQPNPGYLGVDSFTWRAHNDLAESPPTRVSIRVSLPAPLTTSDEYGTGPETSLVVPQPGVLTNDLAEALPVTAEIGGRPSKGNLSLAADGSFIYVPRPGAEGLDRFTYRARTPNSAASSPTTVTIRIEPGNRPPTTVTDTLVVEEGSNGAINVLANDTDRDGDTLVFTGVRQPGHGSVVCTAASCKYTPDADYSGDDLFSYTVSDGNAGTSTGFVSVTVTPKEDPPTAVDDFGSITPGEPVTVDVMANDFDPDGDAISFVSNTQPAEGAVTCTTAGVCTYTPATPDVSADEFTYIVKDSKNNESTGTVTFANDPPVVFSDGPLDEVSTGNTLSCSVHHVGDTLGSFFAEVGCGTFLAAGGTLYGQEFTGATGGAPKPRTVYKPLSQTAVQGDGTFADPYRIVTKVAAGTSGLEIIQTDTYVVGDNFYRTDVEVVNDSAAALTAVLYRGGDCQLGDTDEGFGRRDANTGAVACTNADGRFIEWTPLSAGSSSIETDPNAFWNAIASQAPFPNTCRCTEEVDNAGGISWSLNLPAGASVTRSHNTVFSLTDLRPLTTSLTPDAAVSAPSGANGYTARLTNPNSGSAQVTVRNVKVELPAGFTYVPGSAKGAPEPTALGHTLTWAGPFVLDPGASKELRFGVNAADELGSHVALLSSSPEGTTAPGATATINVIDTRPPIASFTATGPALAFAFDGSDSFDPDGTITAYAWDFGDGATGTGEKPSHTYAAPGTYYVTLQVTDDDGAAGTLTKAVVPRNPNQLPTARFDSEPDGRAATFDGAASTDPDGTIASYVWDFGDGTSGWGPTPTHTYAADGTFNVKLIVTDDRGGTATVTHPVTVALPENLPPIASFRSSPKKLVVGFDGTPSSDPDEADGQVASYAWNFGDSSNGTGAKPSHTYAAPGTYTVTLTVTDRRGATASTSRPVTVSNDRDSNAPPDADFEPEGETLNLDFDGSPSTDSDGEVVAYEWEFADLGFAEGKDASFEFPEAGTYPVRLTVTDNDGAVSDKTMNVTVPQATGENTPPTASFTATPTDLTVAFDATASSDADGTIATYAWNFGDGTTGAGVKPSHNYATAGTYTVVLTVTDNGGLTDTEQKSVTVVAPPPGNQLPIARFTHTVNGFTASFDASQSSDPDGQIVSYAWDFGDGPPPAGRVSAQATGSGVTVTHTYAQAGTYPVTLTVTDDDGGIGTASNNVVIAAVPPSSTSTTAPTASSSSTTTPITSSTSTTASTVSTTSTTSTTSITSTPSVSTTSTIAPAVTTTTVRQSTVGSATTNARPLPRTGTDLFLFFLTAIGYLALGWSLLLVARRRPR